MNRRTRLLPLALAAALAPLLAPSVATAQAIAQVALLEPASGATNIAAPPNRFVDLKWQTLAGVDGYKIQVTRFAGFASFLDLDARTVGGSFGQFRFNTDANGTTYYWRVAGYTQNGTVVGPWSEVRTFTTWVDPVRVTEAPAPQTPAQGATLDVGSGPTTFSWSAVAGPYSYEGQIFLSPDTARYHVNFTTFSNVPANVPLSTQQQLLGGATLYWRVRGVRNNQRGPWSALASFTTRPIAAPTPTSPAAGAVASNPVRFSYTPPAGLAYTSGSVEIYAGTAVRPDSLMRTTDYVSADGSAPPLRLANGRTYTWRVKIQDYNSTQPDTIRVPLVTTGNAWSAPATFTVGAFAIADVPTLAAPTAGATNQNRPYLRTSDVMAYATEFEARVGATVVFRETAPAPGPGSSGSGVTALGLPPDATVVWRARFREGSGAGALVGPWSAERTFTTGALDAGLAVPVLVSPADGATVPRGPRTTFVWTLAGTNVGAELQVSRTADFTDLVAVPLYGGSVDGLPEGVVLYWRVRAYSYNTQRPGAWSPARSFTKARTARIATISPASGPYGTRVTITGSDFGPDAAAHRITFGGGTTRAEAGPGGSLVAVVPVGATTGPVALAFDGGASGGPRFVVTGSAQTTLRAASFTAAPLLGSPATTLRATASADFDGDGTADLATGLDAQVLQVRRGLGGAPATLGEPVQYAFAGGARPFVQLVVTDYDSDGRPDLVGLLQDPNPQNWAYIVFGNRSTPGTLAFEVIASSDSDPARLDAADATGDGRPDLAFGAQAVPYGGRASVYGNRFGAASARLALGTGSEAIPSVAFGDLDGDGWNDVAAVNDAGAVSAFRNLGTGGLAAGAFGPAVTTPAARPGVANAGVAAGDLDGDGRADIVVALPNANALAVYPSTGPFGSFAAPVVVDLAAGSMPRYPRVSDVDGDGRPDILVETSTGVVLVQALAAGGKAGSLALGAPVRLDAGAPGVGVAVGDVDGDGARDVLVATASGVRAFRGTVAVAAEPGPDAPVFGLALAGPNPARTASALRLTLSAPSRARVSVYDVLGREVARVFEGAAPSGETAATLDVSGLAPGLYLVRLSAGGQTATRALVVAR